MKTVHVAAAIIVEGNKIFATQRGYGDYKDWWEFPGGKLEPGETPEEALRREIREELDTEVSVGELFASVEYDYPKFHLQMDCFICKVISGDLVLREHEAARWLSPEEFGSVKWLPSDLEVIERLQHMDAEQEEAPVSGTIEGMALRYWEKAPTAMGIYDYKDGNLSLVALTDKYYEMIGSERGTRDQYNAEVTDAIHPDDKPVVAAELTNAVRENRDMKTRVRIRLDDGSYRWFGASGTHEMLADETVRFYIVYYDVTELMRAQRKASVEERILHNAMSHADMFYFIYYPDNKSMEILAAPDANDEPAIITNLPGGVIKKSRLNTKDAAVFSEMIGRIDAGEPEAECTIQMWQGNKYEWVRTKVISIQDADVEGRFAVGFATNADEIMHAKERIADEVKMSDALRKDGIDAGYVNLTGDYFEMGKLYEANSEAGREYEEWIYDEAMEADPRIAEQSYETRTDLLLAAQDIVDKESRLEYMRRFSRASMIDAHARGETEVRYRYRRYVDGRKRWIQTKITFSEDPETGDLLGFFYVKDVNKRVLEDQIAHMTAEKNVDFTSLIRVEDSTITFSSMSDEYKKEIGIDRKLWTPLEYSIAVHDDVMPHMEDADYREFVASIKLAPVTSEIDENGVYTVVYSTGRDSDRLHRKQITYRWLDDTKEYVLATQNDVTLVYEKEQLQMEQLAGALEAAENANLAKSEFLSRMSHDIRTPMNAIIGFSTLLLRDAENPEKVTDSAKKILSSGRHLLGLINDVLDMSKIESGKMQISTHEFSLSDTISSIEGIMRPLVDEKNQDFEIYVSGLAHDKVIADENRLQQILINMLSNSVKYTHEGGHITLRISSTPERSRKYDDVVFVVEDNGRGMSEEFREKIFDPYSREGETEKHQGTGLGLAITRNLVGMMGGSISVESELGKGSTFTVVIPMRITEKDHDPEFWKNHHVFRMLAVDDDEEVIKNIADVMTESGIRIDHAMSGADAICKVRDAHSEGDDYDIVLLDWLMPDIDGIEAAREIRRLLPPEDLIIILTAYDYSSVEAEGTEAGINAFMMKPFFVSTLQQTVGYIRGDKVEKPDVSLQAADIPHHGDVPDNPLAGLRILAAEDNELNAEILEELLAMNEAAVVVEPDGSAIVERFRSEPAGVFDLILMDVMMPVMNGYEATEKIRALAGDEDLPEDKRSEAASIPVIAMTANAFSEDVQRAIQSGMNAHVAKPLNIEVLKKTVGNALK